MAKITKEQWEKRINDAGAGRYEFIRWAVDDKFGSNHKCVVRCVIDGFEWSVKTNNLVDKGNGCPHCAGKRRWTAEERIEQINSLENIEFVSWVDGYKGANSKANVRCMKDGFEWAASVGNLVNHGSGCPQCSGKRRWTAEERIEQIKSLENINFISWVDGYKNAFSKANVKCLIDGFEWSASVSSLVNQVCGCPQCSNLRRWTTEERIKQINDIDNIEFVSWVDGYKNAVSMANVKCTVDGFKWRAAVNDLVNKGSGCPQCAGLRRWASEERIEQINSLDNISFISWVDYHNGNDSKANVKCNIDGFEWAATVNSLIHNGTGCPKCAKSGYNRSKTGTLYALRSECGKYVKVGISNRPAHRHKDLERATPFIFSCVEQISGDGAKIAELEKHFHNKYESAGFTGFDGCTEWLICTPQLLEELRELEDVK